MNLEEEYENDVPCQGVKNKIYLCVFSALVHLSESEKDEENEIYMIIVFISVK